MKFLNFSFLIYLFGLPSILIAQDFDIYVSSGGNHSIIKYDQNGENPSVFIPIAGGGLGWPQDIIFLENENTILVSSFNTGSVKKYDANTGDFIEDFINLNVAPTRMIIRDNLLYVLPWAGNGVENPIVRYELDGTFVDEYTSEGVAQAIGMDWDTDGNFYVSSYGSRYVRKFDSEGNDLGFFINSNLAGPTNIWFDDNGDLLVVDYNGGSIKRFDAEGAYLGVFIGGLSSPEGVAFLPNGDILIGNGGTNNIKKYNNEGTFIQDLPTTGVALSTPNAVVIKNKIPSAVENTTITEEKVFVHPNVGNYFNISSDLSRDIESIEVYDILGTLIAKKNLKEGLFWNAKNELNGIYIITIKTQLGNIFSQKVMVQH